MNLYTTLVSFLDRATTAEFEPNSWGFAVDDNMKELLLVGKDAGGRFFELHTYKHFLGFQIGSSVQRLSFADRGNDYAAWQNLEDALYFATVRLNGV